MNDKTFRILTRPTPNINKSVLCVKKEIIFNVYSQRSSNLVRNRLPALRLQLSWSLRVDERCAEPTRANDGENFVDALQ